MAIDQYVDIEVHLFYTFPVMKNTNNNNNKESFLKQEALERLLAKCPRCQTSKGLVTKLIREKPDAQLVHVNCSTCQGSLIAVVFTTGPLVSSVGLVTDLSEQDVQRLHLSEALEEDDLIAMHEALQHADICKELLNEPVS